MIKVFNSFKGIKSRVNLQGKVYDEDSSVDKPNMSVEKWYELQHKLRLQQMAQARAAE